MTTYNELRKINVNSHTEKKDNLTYLSWAWAWDEFKQQCPEATYEIIKTPEGLPYFESHAGAMVYTKVTANNETHEMWLPVMDGKNKAMKAQPYTYSTRNGEKTVEAFTMFDVNKTLMRCLVKNLAMFGLGIYIYAGEDLPTGEMDGVLADFLAAIEAASDLEELKGIYMKAVAACPKDKAAINDATNAKKAVLK
jgi:hypothetical protein